MTNNRKNEIIEMLIKEVDKWPSGGICYCVVSLEACGEISTDEEIQIDNYLYANRPDSTTSTYWWPIDDRQSRIEFLEHLKTIDITKNQTSNI